MGTIVTVHQPYKYVSQLFNIVITITLHRVWKDGYTRVK